MPLGGVCHVSVGACKYGQVSNRRLFAACALDFFADASHRETRLRTVWLRSAKHTRLPPSSA